MKSSSFDPLKDSIITAMKEEGRPAAARYLKVFLLAGALSLGFAAVLWLLWPSDFNSVVIAVGCSLLAIFTSGFFLYFYPQPRIIVPGFWMPWMWGRLLIFMGIISTLQLIFCPDLAGVFGVESSLPWLTQLTHIFMDIGGMKACMLACGILFSGISSLLALFSLRKVLTGSRIKWVLAAALFVFIGQAPVIICQVMNQTENLIFWMAGSILSIFISALILRCQNIKPS